MWFFLPPSSPWDLKVPTTWMAGCKRVLLSLAVWSRVWLIEKNWFLDRLTEWMTDSQKNWFCHDELINSIYDHKKTQRNADVSSVSPSSKFSLGPRLQGSAQIFERTKTCTDPPFVYTGPAAPCAKLLNGKVCKFFTWSEVSENFWRGPLFSQLAEVSFRKTREKWPLLTGNPPLRRVNTWTVQVFAQFAR